MLNSEQINAVHNIMDLMVSKDNHFLAITGGAGTGKTYTALEYLTDVQKEVRDTTASMGGNINDFYNHRVYILGPTHKSLEPYQKMASGPVSNISRKNRPHLETIHKFFGLKPSYPMTTTMDPQSIDVKSIMRDILPTLFVIEEGSMVCFDMALSLLHMINECKGMAKLLVIGDPYQLTPVKETYSKLFDPKLKIPTLELLKSERFKNNKGLISLIPKLKNSIDSNAIVPLAELLNKLPTITRKLSNLKIHGSGQTGSDMYLAYTYAALNTASLISAINQMNTHVIINDPKDCYSSSKFTYNLAFDKNNSDLVHAKIYLVGGSPMSNNTRALNDIVDEVYTFKINELHDHVVTTLKLFLKNNSERRSVKSTEAWINNGPRPLLISPQNPYLTVHKSQGKTFGDVYVDISSFKASKASEVDQISRLLYVALTRTSQDVYIIQN
jgi:hypothetical protein